MTVLYLTEEGSYLCKEGNRLKIKKSKDTLKEIGLEKIENIVLVGNTHITTPLTAELLEREIPITWLSSTGKFYGRLEPTTYINIERQREQFRKGDDEIFCHELSKSFITGKIKNSQVLLRRYNRNKNSEKVEEIIKELKQYHLKVCSAESIEQMLGFEGNASKIYFKALGIMVKDEFHFTKRTRQPPKDPFNSLLSFGYTLLTYEIYTALINKGLHPYAGFMHQIRKGHPALASDLIEEWRPVIIDSLVMSLVQKEEITLDDFFPQCTETEGVYLNKEASKLFIKKFEEKIRQHNSYLTYVDYPLSFRESLQFQAGSLAKSIEENDPSIYRPVLIR